MEKNLMFDVHEKPSKGLWALLSIQHVFAMFGATVLVPMLTGLSIGVALVASGVGTLIYIALTKAKVPVYLGSSFAYISAISIASDKFGPEGAFVGLMVVGIIYIIVATIIKFLGKEWLDRLLPPLVVGPMIIIIGLGLAPVAIGQAGLNPNHVDLGFVAANWKNPIIALITFSATVGTAVYSKGFFKVIPFLIGILTGYVSAVVLGVVDLTEIFSPSFIRIPEFTFIGTYKLELGAILMFAPIAFVTIAEHIGDHKVLGAITERDFLQDPGLEKTLMGDGIATLVSACIGGPANTTYGENTGVVAMTKVASVWVIGTAAVIAIFLGFIGPVNDIIASIPLPVMGGVATVLFGLIAANGLKVLINAKINLSSNRNVLIIATMFVIGLGGAVIKINEAVSITGMAFAALVGVILNLVLIENK